MPKERIILLIPNIEYGGAQKSFVSLANELSHIYEVIVCVFYIPEKFGYKLNDNVEIVELDNSTSDNLFGKGVNFFKRLNRLNEIISSYSVEIVVSFLEGANYINCLSKANNKIISIRGSIFSDQTITGVVGLARKYFLMPLLYPMAKSIIVVNEGIKNELRKFKFISTNKIKVIVNFYDSEKIEDSSLLPKPAGFGQLYDKSKILVTVGRLAPEKGYNYLLEIFNEFSVKNSVYKLVIVGDGAQKTELINHAEYLFGKENVWHSEHEKDYRSIKERKVFFIGYSDNPYKWMKSAKAYLLTSTSEGYPNVLRESMIVGTPVISSDCPDGPRHMLSDNCIMSDSNDYPEIYSRGVLLDAFKPDDVNAKAKIKSWVDGLEKVLGDENLLGRISSSGKEWSQTLSKEKIIDLWLQVIKK
ncbi:glycosyltransferase [Marinigracilibium pacificum]|uniref:Glycosyltransferase n=1 Tax=Marinigracilibium pacificum TaxID=2729599 RepID=A0A848IWW1_9BACT|nr:glycosyltransferase [Marinigracilibium pacificum]NMM48807.1 glycosyltransferase [Marinigracilibium pacificum]